jgi:hypothetical protein
VRAAYAQAAEPVARPEIGVTADTVPDGSEGRSAIAESRTCGRARSSDRSRPP